LIKSLYREWAAAEVEASKAPMTLDRHLQVMKRDG